MSEPVNLVLGIVGIAGFLLASFLAWLEWHRYRIPLQMMLTEVKYVGQTKDNHLVLLCLAFVNPALAGKTVFHILGGAPNSEVFSPCPYQYEQGQDIVICRLPNSDKAVIVQKNELLWLPLDISPHQSQTKWYPALIKHMAVELVNQQYQVHLHLIAQDVLGKQLASYDRDIELRTHTIC